MASLFTPELWLVTTQPTRKKLTEKDYRWALQELFESLREKNIVKLYNLQLFGIFFHGYAQYLNYKLSRAVSSAEKHMTRFLKRGLPVKERKKKLLQEQGVDGSVVLNDAMNNLNVKNAQVPDFPAFSPLLPPEGLEIPVVDESGIGGGAANEFEEDELIFQSQQRRFSSQENSLMDSQNFTEKKITRLLRTARGEEGRENGHFGSSVVKFDGVVSPALFDLKGDSANNSQVLLNGSKLNSADQSSILEQRNLFGSALGSSNVKSHMDTSGLSLMENADNQHAAQLSNLMNGSGGGAFSPGLFGGLAGDAGVLDGGGTNMKSGRKSPQVAEDEVEFELLEGGGDAESGCGRKQKKAAGSTATEGGVVAAEAEKKHAQPSGVHFDLNFSSFEQDPSGAMDDCDSPDMMGGDFSGNHFSHDGNDHSAVMNEQAPSNLNASSSDHFLGAGGSFMNKSAASAAKKPGGGDHLQLDDDFADFAGGAGGDDLEMSNLPKPAPRVRKMKMKQKKVVLKKSNLRPQSVLVSDVLASFSSGAFGDIVKMIEVPAGSGNAKPVVKPVAPPRPPPKFLLPVMNNYCRAFEAAGDAKEKKKVVLGGNKKRSREVAGMVEADADGLLEGNFGGGIDNDDPMDVDVEMGGDYMAVREDFGFPSASRSGGGDQAPTGEDTKSLHNTTLDEKERSSLLLNVRDTSMLSLKLDGNDRNVLDQSSVLKSSSSFKPSILNSSGLLRAEDFINTTAGGASASGGDLVAGTNNLSSLKKGTSKGGDGSPDESSSSRIQQLRGGSSSSSSSDGDNSSSVRRNNATGKTSRNLFGAAAGASAASSAAAQQVSASFLDQAENYGNDVVVTSQLLDHSPLEGILEESAFEDVEQHFEEPVFHDAASSDRAPASSQERSVSRSQLSWEKRIVSTYQSIQKSARKGSKSSLFSALSPALKNAVDINSEDLFANGSWTTFEEICPVLKHDREDAALAFLDLLALATAGEVRVAQTEAYGEIQILVK